MRVTKTGLARAIKQLEALEATIFNTPYLDKGWRASPFAYHTLEAERFSQVQQAPFLISKQLFSDDVRREKLFDLAYITLIRLYIQQGLAQLKSGQDFDPHPELRNMLSALHHLDDLLSNQAATPAASGPAHKNGTTSHSPSPNTSPANGPTNASQSSSSGGIS